MWSIILASCLICSACASNVDVAVQLAPRILEFYQKFMAGATTPSLHSLVYVRSASAPQTTVFTPVTVPSWSLDTFRSGLEVHFKRKISDMSIASCPTPASCVADVALTADSIGLLTNGSRVLMEFSVPIDVSTDTVGIDFGTSSSRVSVVDKSGTVNVLFTMQTAISFDPAGNLKMGKTAFEQHQHDCANSIIHIKRFIGRKWTDAEIQDHQLHCKNLKEKDGHLWTNFSQPEGITGSYPLEYLASLIFAKLKLEAERVLGKKLEKAVVSIPAGSSEGQKRATKLAAELGGWKLDRLVHEPSMAAHRLMLQPGEQNIAVFDVGAGTFDMSFMTKFANNTFRERVIYGDQNLGGISFTDQLYHYLLDEFEKHTQINLLKEVRPSWWCPFQFCAKPIIQGPKVWQVAEETKIELSTNHAVVVDMSCFHSARNVVVNVQLSALKHKIADHLAKFRQRVFEFRRMIEELGVDIQTVSIHVVGGGALFPLVPELIEQEFGKVAEHGIDPLHEVSKGLALYAQGSLSLNYQSVLYASISHLVCKGRQFSCDSGYTNSVLFPRFTILPANLTRWLGSSERKQSTADVSVYRGEGENYEELQKLKAIAVPLNPRIEQVKIRANFNLDMEGILHMRVCQIRKNGADELCSNREVDLHSVQIIPNPDVHATTEGLFSVPPGHAEF